MKFLLIEFGSLFHALKIILEPTCAFNIFNSLPTFLSSRNFMLFYVTTQDTDINVDYTTA